MTTQPLALRSVGVPDRNSYPGLTKLCEQYPTISIVVLSGEREAMLGALQLMCGGNPNVQAEIHARDDASAAQANEKKPAINRSQLSTSDLGLTERQLDVLALMTQGKSNKAICRVLNLAEPTVKNHVTAILRALKVSNRTEAVIAVGAIDAGQASPLLKVKTAPCGRAILPSIGFPRKGGADSKQSV
jgi:DNA-binding NarL/FixJ family response regulator